MRFSTVLVSSGLAAVALAQNMPIDPVKVTKEECGSEIMATTANQCFQSASIPLKACDQADYDCACKAVKDVNACFTQYCKGSSGEKTYSAWSTSWCTAAKTQPESTKKNPTVKANTTTSSTSSSSSSSSSSSTEPSSRNNTNQTTSGRTSGASGVKGSTSFALVSVVALIGGAFMTL